MNNKTTENAKTEAIENEKNNSQLSTFNYQLKVPKLRFKEFSGEWVEKKLFDYFPKIRNGFVGTATPYYTDDGILYLQGKNIKNGQILNNGYVQITKDFHIKQSKSQLFENDIVMVQSGHVGECAVITKDFNNTNCHALLVMTPIDTIKSEFIVYYFYTNIGKNLIDKIKTGNTIEHILSSDLKLLKINLPTLPEQQKIADCLSTWDDSIENLKSLIENKKLYKKGMMQKIFNRKSLQVDSGKLTVDNKIRFKPSKSEIDQLIEKGYLKNENGQWIATADSPIIFNSQLSTFNYREWVEKKLGDVAEVIMGQSPSSKSYNQVGEGIPLIQGNADCKNRRTMPRFHTTQSTKECKIEDIIMTVRAPVGFISKSIHNACIGRGVCAIRAIDSTEFIYQKLLDFENRWETYSQGSTFTAVNSNDIKSLTIDMPCIEEQTQIANFLSAIDDEIELLEQELEQLQLQKKGLMQGMFV